MLITVTGCKTGKKYTTPVGFYRNGDFLWILSSRNRTWWRNVKDGGDVEMRIHGKDVKGFAEAILNEDAVTKQVVEYVRHIPMVAKSLGVRVENGDPNLDDAAQLAQDRLFVKIKLNE